MLEGLYPINLIERTPLFAFLMGLGYSIIGVGLAVILFPEDPALVAVALIAIMFYPTIRKLMKQEELIESEKKEFNPVVFLKDHRDVFLVYLLFFLGALLGFSLLALLLPSLATNYIFENQINVLYGNIGRAGFSKGLFFSLLNNNFVVLFVIFITAFVLGDGGAFLIIWNASVWGTIFGNLAKTAAVTANVNHFLYFGLVIAIVMPHMLLEAFAYVASATTGGVISRAIIKEKLLSSRFNHIIVNIIISLVFAFLVLLIAAFVETYVLGNVQIYKTIIRQSFM